MELLKETILLANKSIGGFMVPGIILLVAGVYTVIYSLEYMAEANIMIMLGHADSTLIFERNMLIISTIIGVIMLIIGLVLLSKGLKNLKAFHQKIAAPMTTSFTPDGRRHFAPAQCVHCGGSMIDRRCSSCRAAWCSNCGTWSEPGAINCSTCHDLLPS